MNLRTDLFWLFDLPTLTLTYASGRGVQSADPVLDMDFIINEADAALRQALQAQGLVVGGADTQDRLTEFVTDSLRTTQCVIGGGSMTTFPILWFDEEKR